jgi:TonB-dependent receptor
MEVRDGRRARLKLGVSAVVLAGCLGLAPGVSAQTAGDQAETVDEVIVTGIRASLRDAADVKRNSLQVVDAISAEDIGDFPDKNLGEALQRVTGVQISRQDGEGRGVSIRGADPRLNRVEINGSSALGLTVGGGRDVDFRDLPVEFVSRLEVVKSQTPEQTEGGIGGVVRVVTRRPFDNGGAPYLAGSAQGVYSNLAEKLDPKLALIGSRTFFDDKLGVLLGGTWEQRNLHSHNARTTGWIRRAPTATGAGATPGRGTDVNGDGTLDWVPEIPRYIIDTRETKRHALNGIVELRPFDGLTFFAEGTYAKAHEEVRSSLMQLAASGGLIDYSRTTLGADNTVNHIELTSSAAFPMDLTFRNINGSLNREQFTTAIGGKWEVGDFTFDARLTYASAEVQNDEKNANAVIFGVPRAIVDYTSSQRAPNFSFPGLDVTTSSGVNQLAAVFNPRTNTQEETGGKFNVEYRPPALPWLTSIKAGVERRDLTQDSLYYQRTTTISARSPLPANAIAVAQSTIANIVDTYSVTNEVEFFKTGDLGFEGGVRFWNNNGDDFYDAVVAASGVAGGNDPYAVNPAPNTNGTYQNFLETWAVEEKTSAAYIQASFSFENFIVPVSGTVGTRYVDTDTLSTGFDRVQQGTTITFPRASRSGGYEKWLPSLNLRFEFPNEVIGRVTAGKVMARPYTSDLALRRSLDIVGLTGSRGNPDLQPFEATQYDAGLEWYFTRDGFVSATYFHKEISSFITRVTTPEENEGTIYSVSRPINGTDEVTIDGIEFGVQYAFDFLPAPFDGFGALFNYTYQKDEGYKGVNLVTGETLPFEGLSRKSYNASVYYENDRYSARLSYNWRDRWLITANGRGGLPEFNEAFGSLDGSASWTVNDTFTIFVEGINLTDEVRIEHNSPVRRIGNETYGSRYFFGVRAKF